MFQPSHYDPNDTTVMYHIKFKPSGTGPWPTVLMLPPDVFKIEIKAAGTTKERVATRDVTDNGFLVFQIEHRLALTACWRASTSTILRLRESHPGDLRNKVMT